VATFLGTYENRIDSKGRISVPALFRAQLPEAHGQTVVLFPSYRAPAIEGCGMDFIEQLGDSISEIDLFSDDQDDLATSLFSDSQPLGLDREGRVVLPGELMKHAGITDRACFVGKGRLFQIWRPDALTAHKSEARQRARTKGLTLPIRPRRGGE
jgi:MraZ protein